MVCDTRLTREGYVHRTLLDGGLKCVIASPTCCIGFAGSLDLAVAAISPVLAFSYQPRREIVAHLREAHFRAPDSVAFLIAFADHPVSICRLDRGQFESDLKAAWIGDEEAFHAYQGHFNTPAPNSNSGSRSTMTAALEAVACDPAYPTVGDFVFSVDSEPPPIARFSYNPSMRGYGSQPVSNTTVQTSLMRSVGAAGGGYRHTVLVPQPGIGALGVYMYEPRIGICFCPASSWSPFVCHNVSVAEFKQRVSAHNGVSLDGFHWPEHDAT
jgi:hypothetical protein